MAEKPDPELDELLDSAAKDFQKTEAKPSSTDAIDPSQFLNPDGSMNQEKWKKWQEEQDKKCQELYEKAQEDFEGSDLAKEFEQKMQEGLAAACQEQGLTPEEMSNRLKNLNLFGEVPGLDADKEKEFSDAIMGAMQSLKENLSEASTAAREGEDGDGDDAAGGEMENLMMASLMQPLMMTLLSKELLLPSFKEMSEKYPAWLEENKSKLSEADFKRCTDQMDITKQIVTELEKEGYEDDQQNLDRMVELMGKAQELGQPPQGLTAQLESVIDDSKVEELVKANGDCNIM